MAKSAARILLIEDDPYARELLRERLEKSGYDITEAQDGDEGFMKALRKPDLIILDVRIPKIDGWELCRQLRTDERTAKLPILMLTGCSQPLQAEIGIRSGADAYLTKPWDNKALLSTVARLLRP